MNTAIEPKQADYPYVGYKGGSEPGVLNMTWLSQSKLGRWYVVTMSFSNSTDEVDTAKALAVATGIFSLLRRDETAAPQEN